jgi:hypothetical protein
LCSSFILASLSETITERPPEYPNKIGKMSAPSPVLPTADVEDRIEDEKKMEEPASDANTMVEKTDATDTEAENEPELITEPEEELTTDEYPKGLQFAFILLALILSIFMVALDLVCLAPVF